MHLKNLIYKIICVISAVTVFCSGTIYADEIEGRMSAAYGYALNDTMREYGVVKGAKGEEFIDPYGGEISPGGIVHAEILNFDANNSPYLVIFCMNSDTRSAEAHVWRYDEETKKAVKLAKIDKPYHNIGRDRMGEFNVGYDDEKRYISYKQYENNILVSEEYYTVINNEAFMYVNKPKNVYDVGIMNFNCAYFHPNVDISGHNKLLGDFFSKLKNVAADSVTFEDMAERPTLEEEDKLEDVLSRAVHYTSFDILKCSSMQDYRKMLDETATCTDRFYLITNMYDLGNELYYVRFSTDRSFYNYTLLRRSNNIDGGYQILRVNADCIPLSDSELKQIAEEYSRCPLLYKKATGNVKLKSSIKKLNLPKVNVEKKLDEKVKVPVALIGGGIGAALLTVLWFVLSMSDDE